MSVEKSLLLTKQFMPRIPSVYITHVTYRFSESGSRSGSSNHSSTMDFFETYSNCLTIDCWYLIKGVLQSRLL